MFPHQLVLELRDLFRFAEHDSLDQSISIEEKMAESSRAVISSRLVSQRFLNDCHEYVFHFTKSGRIGIDRSRSVFLIRTRATLHVGHTRAGAIAVVAATHGSFRMRRFKAALRSVHTRRRSGRAGGVVYQTTRRFACRHHARSILGIGNSAIAAKIAAFSRFIGFEIDEAYLAEAQRRIGAQASLPVGQAGVSPAG